jgi:adenosylcobinamide-GDP ribazoletransferase
VLTAVAFLTRIPVPAKGIPNLNRAAVYFPLVGLLVGALAAATRALADQVLQPLPATVLAVAAAIIVTGALHEDGLADVADALGAHTTQARRREILKDPRVGTMGALALILAVGLSTTALASLDTAHAAKALVISHVLARWAMLPVSRALQPATQGSGSLLRVSTPALMTATAIAIAITLATSRDGLAALLAAGVAAIASAAILQHALGGITGDGYGATAKLAELAAVTTLVALWT